MSSSMEHEVKIPEIIVDVQNKKKYRRCGFLGKVTIYIFFLT